MKTAARASIIFATASAPAALPSSANERAPHPEPAHSAPHAAPAARERNPHLHGLGGLHPAAKAGKTPHDSVSEKTRDEDHRRLYDAHRLHELWWAHHWIYAGDILYTDWLLAHANAGIIEGDVMTPNNIPVAGAHVWLRKPGGKKFRIRGNAHGVHTNAAGHFVMRGVHPGSYRLMTNVSGRESHMPIHAGAGLVARAEVRM